MRNILKRLDILEQVFVFVDIEQINQVLKKCSANLNEKVGTDLAAAIGQWEAMSEKTRSKSPTESGGSESRTNSCDAQRIQETHEPLANQASNPLDIPGPRNVIKEGLHRGLHDPPPWEGISPPQDLSPHRLPKRLPPLSGPDTPTSELRYREWDGLSNATDEHDKMTTCSTWDLCSTRSGWNDESEVVDPSVFKKFMSQALKPKWESRPQDVVLVQNIEEDHSTQQSTASTAYWSELMGNSKPQSSDP